MQENGFLEWRYPTLEEADYVLNSKKLDLLRINLKDNTLQLQDFRPLRITQTREDLPLLFQMELQIRRKDCVSIF